MELHHPATGEEQPVHRDEHHHPTGHHGSHRRTGGPKGGYRSQAADEDDVEHQVQERQSETVTQGCLRVAGGTESGTDQEEHQHANAVQEQDAQIWQRFGLNFGRRVHQPEQPRRQKVPERREDAEGKDGRGYERLVYRPVDLLRLVFPRKSGDQDSHSHEQGIDEEHDHEEDLPGHSNGGVSREPDVVADHRVIDDAL